MIADDSSLFKIAPESDDPARPWQASLAKRLVLAIVTLGFLLPFLGKPFHIDDPVYLAIARQILAHPLDPFGFDFYWFDSLKPMWTIVSSPPGLGHLLAPLIAVFGERETILHGVFLIFPLGAVADS